MNCPNCNTELSANARFCPNCGEAIVRPAGENAEYNKQAEPLVIQPTYNYNQSSGQSSESTKSDEQPCHGKAIASLVLGILSLVFPYFGLATSIVGLVLGQQAKSAGNTEGINTAGRVLSIIGVCINGFWFVVLLFGISCVPFL